MSHTTTHTTHRNEQRRQLPESTGLGVVDTSELAADNSDDDAQSNPLSSTRPCPGENQLQNHLSPFLINAEEQKQESTKSRIESSSTAQGQLRGMKLNETHKVYFQAVKYILMKIMHFFR